MEIERVVNKTLRDMIQAGIISEENRGYARPYLNRVFAAGRTKKGVPIINGGIPVCYFDKAGSRLGEFHNCKEASRELGVYISVIYRSIKFKRFTRGGYKFKYKEATPDSSL
jgi:hypothetical protein